MTQKIFDSQSFIRSLTSQPGVYKMKDAKGTVLYVGKAKNLKKRVSSYFQKTHTSAKTHQLVRLIADIEVIVTHSETEALILENNLIKSLKPRYNVLFRDDKGYPYIYFDEKTDYPRFVYYRGAKKQKHRYFGPYPNAYAVREALNFIQKTFKIRTCEDSFFRNRSRACLQYQIKRCSGPCVNLISQFEYNSDIKHALLFLEGKNEAILNDLTESMAEAAKIQNYESAAELRDQISAIRTIQEKQAIEVKQGSADVIVFEKLGDLSCVLLLMVREGRVIGFRHHIPQNTETADQDTIVAAYLEQHYLSGAFQDFPKEIILDVSYEHADTIEKLIFDETKQQTKVIVNVRGQKAGWVKLAKTNAKNCLRQIQTSDDDGIRRTTELQTALDLSELPVHIECFDISHTFGEATIASCVVFENGLANKKAYRRFKINHIQASDDYAAMSQALMRRYKKLKETDSKLPNIVLVDGGKGQLTMAKQVFEELQINDVTLVGVAKGPSRKAGLEQIFVGDSKQAIQLPDDSSALHLIQAIRDEAHRFAITGHRKKRDVSRTRSKLENIPGVGAKRRKALLQHFGGIQGVEKARIEELSQVEGISKSLAKSIYDFFHTA